MARAFVAAALSIGLVLPAVADDASSTVETLAKKWVKAYNAHSGADIAAMFTQDAVFLGPPGVLKGAPAIEKAMDARFKQGWATEELKVNEAHAIGDTIWAIGEFAIKGAGEQAGKQQSGNWGELLIHDGSDWRIRMLVATPGPAP